MAKKCAIIPRVRNKKGEIVDSNLYKGLLQIAPREESTNAYLITKNTEFQKKWDSVLSKDENGEYTLSSLLEKTPISKTIGDVNIISKLNKELGNTKEVKLIEANNESLEELSKRAIVFNQRNILNKDFVATIDRTSKNSTPMYSLTAKRATNNLKQEAHNMEVNVLLNSKLRDILSEHGVSVGALTNLENRRGINGVTDFSKAKDAANGLVELIRLSEGIEGERVLPEEFAHFAIEALGNNPLVDRLVTMLDNNGLVETILGTEHQQYIDAYKGDKVKLAKEAAGKLVAKHLLQNEAIPNTGYKSLLGRVIESIKSFFKRLQATSIQKAMMDADSQYSKFAKQLLSGELKDSINIGNISSSEEYYNLQERIERDRKLVNIISENEHKRLKIYEQRNPESKFNTTQRIMIDKLELSLIQNQEVEGIYEFLQQGLEDLAKVENRLAMMMGTSTKNYNDRARTLRDVRNYIYSYSNMIEEIQKANREESRLPDNRYGERVGVALTQAKQLIDNLKIDYEAVAKPLFLEFLEPIFGKTLTIEMGKNKGKELTIEEILMSADKDISTFDRWLDSAADSSDYMIKFVDNINTKSKELARLSTISLTKELQALGVEYEQKGIKDYSWMFEKNSKGDMTGNYITEINHGLFKEEMSKMYKALHQKYGEKPVGDNEKAFIQEKKNWFNANMENLEDGSRQPLRSKYLSREYANMTPVQREFYEKVMSIKERLDNLLPDGVMGHSSAIKIRKDLMERVREAKDIKSGARQLWEGLKDEVIRRTDDTDFEYKNTLMDFEGREIESLPIFYTSMKQGENANDLSTDIISTLIAYGAMANDYHEMNKVIEVLEVGRDLMRTRKIGETAGNKPVVEKFKSLGRTIETKLTKRTEESHFLGRLNDYFSMQVYGKYMKDEGTIGDTNLDWGKMANMLNRITSVNNLALNALSGISNVATGKVMMRIESMAGEFFKEKDTLRADNIYRQEMPKFLGELGNRVKTSKLSLFSELFNVMQEYEQDVRETNFDRKTWFSRMFNTSSLFIINNAGEHWMQNRTALALANTYRMKDNKGKEVSLWESLEVKYRDPSNHALGATLVVREGYTKLDGSEFSTDDIIKFSRKSAAINQRMHGIYNKLDRSAVQRLALGRLGMMFRKWMKPSLNRRFKSASKNYDLDSWTEGYYITTFNFLKTISKDLAHLNMTVTTHWDKLNNTEKSNIRRAVTEMVHFLLIMGAIGLLNYWDDDDKDKSHARNMTEYQLRRLYTELGALTPSPFMIDEGLRLLKSPAASVNTAEKVVDTFALMNPWNYEFFGGEEAVIQSGAYKGKSKAMRTLLRSPLAPMYNTAMRIIHVEDQIPFFKQ